MSEKIDINVADAETLAMIPGIGPALAERIIAYRQTVHPFEEVIELAAVPGISEKMVRKFENLVTVGGAVAETAVSTRITEPEEPLLLDAPETHEMLSAPPQPEGLLTAEVSAPAEEERDLAEVAEIAIEEAEGMAEADDVEEEAEVVADAVEDVATAVSPLPPPTPEPQIEAASPVNPREEITSTPDPVRAAPPIQTPHREADAQRRGCISTLLGATFGAILGAVLTLAILAALNNGSLTFTDSDNAIRQQLNTEIISRTNELNQLSTRVSLAVTQEAASNQALQDEFAAANETLSEEIGKNQENISHLATRSGDLAQQIEDVAGAADTFTDFLDGLRGLLNDLDGGTATATPAPFDETTTPTPTPFGGNTATVEPAATTAVSPTNTPTGVPTRTPLPTATPFTFPTNTPAPQP